MTKESIAILKDEFTVKLKTEIIKVDFRPDKDVLPQKKMIIVHANGSEEELILDKRPTYAELMAIVGGFPECFSMVYKGMIRSVIYSHQNFKEPYHLNTKITDLRAFAKIDPRKQIWGTAIIIVGYRYGRQI
jgi:hypothetical protein